MLVTFAALAILSSSFFHGASGTPNAVGPLPANFSGQSDGSMTVTLGPGEVLHASLRDFYYPVTGDVVVEASYEVVSGNIEVAPQVWKIGNDMLHGGGALAVRPAHGPNGVQSVRARFGAVGGSGSAVWPEPIAWPAGTTRYRPSLRIAEASGGNAVLKWLGFSALPAEPEVTAQTIAIPSSVDSYQQPAKYLKGAANKPVIVSLHTWHGTYGSYDSYAATLQFAAANDWTFISPDFRGAANDPINQILHAGSTKAIQDVLDARAWALADSGASPAKVYVIGGSGGGYMALLVAAKNPSLFKAVGVYAAITDLREWWEWCSQRAEANLTIYSGSVAASLGGTPTQQAAAYEARSPITWLSGLETMPVHIQHGIEDATVPVLHAINAFNEVAEAKGLDDDQIVGRESAALSAKGLYGSPLPADIAAQGVPQGQYTYARPFVRKAGNVELVLEQVGHNGDLRHIFDFLQSVEAGTF